jgi:hypothetical protein
MSDPIEPLDPATLLFPVDIPEYTDPADIRKAFYRYHYGTDSPVTTPEQIQSDSMTGYIRDTLLTLQQAQNRLSQIVTLTNQQSLNGITANGIYHSTLTPNVDTLRYPTTTPGLLSVVSSNNNTYQTYQTTNLNDENSYYWRVGTFNQSTGEIVWSPWASASKSGHTHDDRYYTETEINNKISITMDPSRATATDATGRVVTTAVTATQLGYLGGAQPVTSSVQQQLNDKAALTHYHDDRYYLKSSVTNPQANGEKTVRVFVQSSTPSGAVAGDLWFW